MFFSSFFNQEKMCDVLTIFLLVVVMYFVSLIVNEQFALLFTVHVVNHE